MKIFADMDTEQFWLTVWSLASVVLLSMTLAIVWNSHNEDKILRELVAEGHDILELSCLFNQGSAVEIPCLLLAQEKAKTYVHAK